MLTKKVFKIGQCITRAEFAAIIVRALGPKPGMGTNSFNDVKASTGTATLLRQLRSLRQLWSIKLSQAMAMANLDRWIRLPESRP
jgi:hypothetical protein